jgi:hypothetical protein
MAIISDRNTTVQLMLGNRSDLGSRIPLWTANAYIELSSNIPFPDLENTDNILTVANSDTYDYPTNARGLLSVTLLLNNQPRPIKKKNIEYIDNYPTTSTGVPAVWAPFNYKQVLRPVPDTGYTVIRRFWTKPVVDFTTVTTISNSTIMMPDDWLEIVDYASAMRGFAELKDREKAKDTRVLLYGDPKDPTNPGLIKQHLTQIQSENMNSDYGMRMKIRPYTAA